MAGIRMDFSLRSALPSHCACWKCALHIVAIWAWLYYSYNLQGAFSSRAHLWWKSSLADLALRLILAVWIFEICSSILHKEKTGLGDVLSWLERRSSTCQLLSPGIQPQYQVVHLCQLLQCPGEHPALLFDCLSMQGQKTDQETHIHYEDPFLLLRAV